MIRVSRRTARFRLTALYGGVFLMSGVALIAVTYVLFERATHYQNPQLPKIPQAPAIPDLTLPLFLQSPAGISPLAQAQQQVAQAQHALQAVPLGPLATQGRLAQAQHQLAQAQHQLAQAVHQVARAGSLQAAQRAADSHELLVNSGLALVIVAVLALLAGWLVAGRILRPIRTITRAARQISSTSLHERLALDGPDDELKELGDTLDDLLGRLEAAFDAQRHFVANASHELRTPLTAERNLLQVALDDPCASAASWRSTAEELLASNDEQARLIEALLALASSEGDLDHRERTDLADLCHTALARRGPDIGPPDVHVDASIGSAPVDGDTRLLERLVGNLLDNALRHNVAGGQVHVVTGIDDGAPYLSITNTGPVVPPGEIDRLFQPFQRLEPRRTHHDNGHGLGLSIVRAIATTHLASVIASPRAEGGLSVVVTFPRPCDPEASAAGTQVGQVRA